MVKALYRDQMKGDGVFEDSWSNTETNKFLSYGDFPPISKIPLDGQVFYPGGPGEANGKVIEKGSTSGTELAIIYSGDGHITKILEELPSEGGYMVYKIFIESCVPGSLDGI